MDATLEIPKGMRAVITVIWKDKQKSIDLWKELEEDWFKYVDRWTYEKGNMVFKTWYKEDLDKEMFREIKFEEVKPEVVKVIKPKRKKRIKPAQKNKKAKK